MRHEPGEHGFINMTRCRQRTALVIGRSGPMPDEIIDQGAGRSGIKGDYVIFCVRSEPGHIGDAPEIEHHQRLGQVMGECPVIERRERRALPSGSHIGVSEAIDRINPQLASYSMTIAKLACYLPGRVMKYGLAMQADEVNIRPCQPFVHHELRNRIGMCLRYTGFDVQQRIVCSAISICDDRTQCGP